MAHGSAASLESLAAEPVRAVVRDFRDGLMIALLAARPLRQHNFLGIEIGRHLRKLGDGFVLTFAAEETIARMNACPCYPSGSS